jgi:hypothetical protein
MNERSSVAGGISGREYVSKRVDGDFARGEQKRKRIRADDAGAFSLNMLAY